MGSLAKLAYQHRATAYGALPSFYCGRTESLSRPLGARLLCRSPRNLRFVAGQPNHLRPITEASLHTTGGGSRSKSTAGVVEEVVIVETRSLTSSASAASSLSSDDDAGGSSAVCSVIWTLRLRLNAG